MSRRVSSLKPADPFPIMSRLKQTREHQIHRLLARGWDLLESGRSREALDAFGRVLLRHRRHAEARRGLERARAAAAEDARELDLRVEEAREAFARGERERARALLTEVVRRGGDRDRALALLDRLGEGAGRLAAAASPPEGTAEPRVVRPSRRLTWSRWVFAAAWAVVFAVLAAGLALSWERLVETLVRVPAPGEARAGLLR